LQRGEPKEAANLGGTADPTQVVPRGGLDPPRVSPPSPPQGVESWAAKWSTPQYQKSWEAPPNVFRRKDGNPVINSEKPGKSD